MTLVGLLHLTSNSFCSLVVRVISRILILGSTIGTFCWFFGFLALTTSYYTIYLFLNRRIPSPHITQYVSTYSFLGAASSLLTLSIKRTVELFFVVLSCRWSLPVQSPDRPMDRQCNFSFNVCCKLTKWIYWFVKFRCKEHLKTVAPSS